MWRWVSRCPPLYISLPAPNILIFALQHWPLFCFIDTLKSDNSAIWLSKHYYKASLRVPRINQSLTLTSLSPLRSSRISSWMSLPEKQSRCPVSMAQLASLGSEIYGRYGWTLHRNIENGPAFTALHTKFNSETSLLLSLTRQLQRRSCLGRMSKRWVLG